MMLLSQYDSTNKVTEPTEPSEPTESSEPSVPIEVCTPFTEIKQRRVDDSL